MKYECVADHVRTRARPDLNSPDLGWCDRTDVIDAAPIIVGGEGWLRFKIYNNGVWVGVGYTKQSSPDGVLFYRQVDVATPPTSATWPIDIGVNVLSNTRKAQEFVGYGGRSVTIINDFLGASQLQAANPAVSVTARRWCGSWPGENVDTIINQLLEGAIGAKYVTWINEGDILGQDTPERILQRAQVEVAVARAMKERKCTSILAAGGWSVGCPDYTSSEICDAVRKGYAAAYNEGLIAMNMHLYGPLPDYKPDEWHTGRDAFLFTRCGFEQDPRLKGVTCDEWGVDKGSSGGYIGCGMTFDQMMAHQRGMIAYHRNNRTVDGIVVTPKLRKADTFQAGDEKNGAGHWGSYYVGSEQWLRGIAQVAAEAAGVTNVRGLDRAVLAEAPRKDLSRTLGVKP